AATREKTKRAERNTPIVSNCRLASLIDDRERLGDLVDVFLLFELLAVLCQVVLKVLKVLAIGCELGADALKPLDLLLILVQIFLLFVICSLKRAQILGNQDAATGVRPLLDEVVGVIVTNDLVDLLGHVVDALPELADLWMGSAKTRHQITELIFERGPLCNCRGENW